jgi:hypothetical protein
VSDRFLLTTDHLILLQRAYVRWDDCETGAPAIDPKRPYGNSSVALDIAEILGVGVSDDGDLDQSTEDDLLKLHRGTETALQIVLDSLGLTEKVKPGTYERTRGESWRWVS